MKIKNKKGDVAWQTLAAIILGLVVLVVLIAFSGVIKTKILEGLEHFASNILGR